MFCTSAGIQKWNKVFAVYCLLLMPIYYQPIWTFTNNAKHRHLEFLLLIPMRKITSCPPAAISRVTCLQTTYSVLTHVSVLAVMWFSVAFQNTKTVVSAADVKSCQVSTLVVRQTEFKRYFRCPRMPDRLYCPLLRNNHQVKKIY